MATDPEARTSSNSGVIIAVVALVLVVGLAVAFMSMRGNEAGNTTIVNPPSETTIIEAPDTPSAAPDVPDVNVEVAPAEGGSEGGDESAAPAAP